MSLKIGGLCFGYGGLDLAVQSVIPDAELAWYAEFDKGASKIAAHRFPDVPNHGDMTKIDWANVEPVDIITGGFPCQPVSQAGRRRGDEDERWLWDEVLRAVSSLRPSLIVLENVRGLLTARGGQLFGRVLGSLADVGYDARWHGIRASDVGAPHARFRIFIVAHPAGERGAQGDGGTARLRAHPPGAPSLADQRGGRTLLPTPTTRDWKDGSESNAPINSLLGRAVWPRNDWKQYAAAINRWGAITRPAPPPTESGPKGNPRLSAVFSEWLMGLPAGWVTDVPGITRNEALKALGNGVVPQQAAAALRLLLASEVAA